MQNFVHLHVHSQYSLLDGQASIKALVDKAIGDGMKGIALTDHGSMFGVKEFFNYVKKKNAPIRAEIKQLKKKLAQLLKEGQAEGSSEVLELQNLIKEKEACLFKPIIGCEMYVARRGDRHLKEVREDQSGYHLVVLAKNKTGYHNLIKLVSNAWTEGFYMRPRTDRADLEKYREGLIVSTACLGGEVPKKITQGKLEAAEEAVQWFKKVFGDDFYLELQRHKATIPRANHEAYPLQTKVNEYLLKYSEKYQVKLICTNDVHFVDEAH
ncbi:MAG: PHP domain-containing protein, partial [Bacteroides sp.]